MVLATVLFKAVAGLLAVLAAYGLLFVQPLPAFFAVIVLFALFSPGRHPRRGFQSLDE